jgi:arylsulfatase A-like enzyme
MAFFEGGINVPLIMHYPGVIKPRTVMGSPVNLCDVFSTLAAAAQAPLPQDREYDGVSLLPWLTGARKDEPHEALFWWADYNIAVRMGPFKLHVNNLDQTVDLYDLSRDRGESENLYPAQKVTADQLLSLFEAWRKDFPPMSWPRIMDYRLRVNGKIYRWAI